MSRRVSELEEEGRSLYDTYTLKTERLKEVSAKYARLRELLVQKVRQPGSRTRMCTSR